MGGRDVGEDEEHVGTLCFDHLTASVLRAMRDNWPETEVIE
jgi:hypothetical protein